MIEQSPLSPQQEAELLRAGWHQVNWRTWQAPAPNRKLYGAREAFNEMRRTENDLFVEVRYAASMLRRVGGDWARAGDQLLRALRAHLEAQGLLVECPGCGRKGCQRGEPACWDCKEARADHDNRQ
jgi:ribosomal protein L37AE/L43A